MCGKEIEYINQAFDENWIAPLGPNVNAFEKEICAYIGARYAVAMTTGTAAIHMALKYTGVSSGDIVFCSSLTFAASCNPIIYQNAIPVFIDSEPKSWNMSPIALQKAFEEYPLPKAVIVVNLYGQSANMDEIADICKKHNAPIIEDAAESLGAVYKGRQSGSIGDFGILSFNGNKIITTSGGGMLLTNDKAAADKARFWATQSRDPAPHYQHSEIGYNYRMSNIVAGIGRGQLLHLDEHIAAKKRIYQTYQAAFADLPVQMNPYLPDSEPNFWLSCVTIDDGCNVTPQQIMQALEDVNAESRPIWKPMHLQPVFADRDFITAADKPVSEDIFQRGLCLPSDIKMTDEDLKRVVMVVRGVFDGV